MTATRLPSVAAHSDRLSFISVFDVLVFFLLRFSATEFQQQRRVFHYFRPITLHIRSDLSFIPQGNLFTHQSELIITNFPTFVSFVRRFFRFTVSPTTPSTNQQQNSTAHTRPTNRPIDAATERAATFIATSTKFFFSRFIHIDRLPNPLIHFFAFLTRCVCLHSSSPSVWINSKNKETSFWIDWTWNSALHR